MSLFIFSFACKDEVADKKNTGQIPQIKFHTKEQEGRWKNRADDHMPVVKRLENDPYKISVTVPMEQRDNENHYIEVIVLLEGKNKEIAKKSFTRKDTKFSTIFTLPPDFDLEKQLNVVAKCSMHGMWIAPVPKAE